MHDEVKKINLARGKWAEYIQQTENGERGRQDYQDTEAVRIENMQKKLEKYCAQHALDPTEYTELSTTNLLGAEQTELPNESEFIDDEAEKEIEHCINGRKIAQENIKLINDQEKHHEIVEEALKENKHLKNQVAEDKNIKIQNKQLVKKCKTLTKTINNYTVAAEESEIEVEQLNVTIANLKYDLTLAQERETDNDTIKALNDKIRHQKGEIEGMNNSLSDERIRNEKLKESKTEYIVIPNKKLEDSKKKLSEEVKVLKKSNKEKEEQIVELGCKLRDRHSVFDELSSEMKDKVVRLNELEKVLSNYMAVENGETGSDVNEEVALNYKLTQIAEFQRILRVIKEELTIGPLVEEGSCSICFDKLAHYPTETWSSCGHREFCLPCSKKWQNSNPGGALCPICRSKKPMSEREYPSLRK